MKRIQFLWSVLAVTKLEGVMPHFVTSIGYNNLMNFLYEFRRPPFIKWQIPVC